MLGRVAFRGILGPAQGGDAAGSNLGCPSPRARTGRPERDRSLAAAFQEVPSPAGGFHDLRRTGRGVRQGRVRVRMQSAKEHKPRSPGHATARLVRVPAVAAVNGPGFLEPW